MTEKKGNMKKRNKYVIMILLSTTMYFCKTTTTTYTPKNTKQVCVWIFGAYKSDSTFSQEEVEIVKKFGKINLSGSPLWRYDTIRYFPFAEYITEIDASNTYIGQEGLVFFKQFPNLKKIRFQYSGINDLSQLPKIDSLEYLDIALDTIDFKGMQVFFENYKDSKIKSLDFNYCNLDSIPNNICNLTNLRYLYILNNKNLRQLPPCLNNLKSLEAVMATENHDSLIIDYDLRKGRWVEPAFIKDGKLLNRID